MFTVVTALSAIADEGMWLVNDIDAAMYKQMRKMGLKLPLNGIYSEQNELALSNAVVAVNFGSGSGSIISEDGLMITNHHVAYSGICSLTRPDFNVLRDGYWAESREKELPVVGYSVMFLRKIEDATEEALALKAEMEKEGKWNTMSMRRLSSTIEKRHQADSEYEPSLSSMFGGKKFYLFYYEVFRDVRLVACPPERIGAFGGNTDNWGWPQQKADFTVFRVYTAPDGKPAEYSSNNVPLHAKRYLKVAKSCVKDGDFTMILGYPGRTHRYMSSCEVREKMDVRNPIVIDARHKKMDIIEAGMNRNDTVRINYSNKFFGLSNYADYAVWENKCFKRFDVPSIREAEEVELQKWIESKPELKEKYSDLLSQMKASYAARKKAMDVRLSYSERWFGVSEALVMANRLASQVNRLKQKGEYMFDINGEGMDKLRATFDRYNTLDSQIDRNLFITLGEDFLKNMPASYFSKNLSALIDQAGSIRTLLETTYDNSCCRSRAALEEFLKEPKRIKAVMKDPMVVLSQMLPFQPFQRQVLMAEKKAGASVSDLERDYASLLYDYRKEKGAKLYPNANSTMRLTYGKVTAIDPRDGVHYSWYSTTNGYLEKIDATNHDFLPDEKLVRDTKALKAPIMIDFITDNDITGGNSGSAVVNGRGEIVGLAFDGNRDSMAGDVYFDPRYARCVCADIQYIMWILKNNAPAALLEEIYR